MCSRDPRKWFEIAEFEIASKFKRSLTVNSEGTETFVGDSEMFETANFDSTNYQNLLNENGGVDKLEEESCRERSVCAISTMVVTIEIPSSFSSSLENTQEVRSTRRKPCVTDS